MELLSRVAITVTMTHLRGRLAPALATHEPPSTKLQGSSNQARRFKGPEELVVLFLRVPSSD